MRECLNSHRLSTIQILFNINPKYKYKKNDKLNGKAMVFADTETGKSEHDLAISKLTSLNRNT